MRDYPLSAGLVEQLYKQGCGVRDGRNFLVMNLKAMIPIGSLAYLILNSLIRIALHWTYHLTRPSVTCRTSNRSEVQLSPPMHASLFTPEGFEGGLSRHIRAECMSGSLANKC